MSGRSRRPVASVALPTRLTFLALTVLALAAVAAVRRGVDAARDVPLSPLSAGRRVGADWPERAGVVDVDAPVPTGETDDFDAFARPGGARDAEPRRAGFDPDAVDPAVRAFYEETADFRMTYEATWHRPFRLAAALVAPLTSRLGQLNLPGRSGRGGELRSRFREIDPDADPRRGARAWVRTDEREEAVFVAVYATHRRGDERFVNIAAPLPGGNLSTVLRIDHLRPGGAGGTGVRLHTDSGGGGPDDPGLYLVTPWGATRLPLSQEFRVLPADAPGAADAADAAAPNGPSRPDVVAEHRMAVFGVPFLTVDYRIVRADG